MLRSIVIVMGIVKTIVHFAPWVGDIYIQMAIAVLLTLATDSLTERLSNALSNVIVSLVESIPEKINLAYQIYLKSNTKKKK